MLEFSGYVSTKLSKYYVFIVRDEKLKLCPVNLNIDFVFPFHFLTAMFNIKIINYIQLKYLFIVDMFMARR